MDLHSLLERCRSGDALAWEALVRTHQSRVYGIALHYTGNGEDARDVAQEIFVKVYRHLDTCDDAELFVPWLIRLSRNACLDHLRRRKARPPASDVPVEEMTNLPANDADPQERWVMESRKRLLHRALQKMSELNREVILLKEIQGLSLEETAGMLGVPIGTIKSRCSRARLELARKVMELTGQT
jgi:RNA polymerase sigma-70 factor (ECF subfamily)